MAIKLTIAAVIMSFLFGWMNGNYTEFSSFDTGQDDPQQRWSAKKLDEYLGYENCRKCHQLQVEKLVTTVHFKSYESTHRSEKSKLICQQLGIRSIKRSERCIRCHYTPEQSKRGLKAQSGISCESCHGPSKNWIKGHNDYGGLLVTKRRETAEHKRFRISSSIEKGMRHPSNLYLLAKSCYECHLVDDAELVDTTDHPPISAGFNMIAWSQGSMRHNFLRTDNEYNAESNPERLRVMYVVDLMAKIEASLTAAAKATPGSKHRQFLERQFETAAKQLFQVSKLVDNTTIQQTIDQLKSTPPDAPAEAKLATAKRISNLAFKFGKNEKAHALSAIQSLIPAKESYR